MLVAEEHGTGDVAGFVAGGGSRDPDGKGDGEIYALYVDPGRWRHGVGRLLLTGALAALADASFASATLWIPEADVAARAFCEALGWAEDGRCRTAEFGASGLVEDALPAPALMLRRPRPLQRCTAPGRDDGRPSFRPRPAGRVAAEPCARSAPRPSPSAR